MNKLLHRQLQKYTGGTNQVPEKLMEFLQVISESYDHYEKDGKLMERSIELSSKEMIELNSRLKKETADLKKVHKELKTIFEDIDEVLYSVDIVSHKLTQMSAVCKKVYGYTAAEFLADGGLWQRVIHPEDKHIAEHQFQLLFQGKRGLYQYRIIHKDESIRWIQNKIIPKLDKAGRLVQINGVTSDITGRKKTEEELERSVSLLEGTLESTADGLLVVDLNGKIVRFNNKFVELWRIPGEILDSRDNDQAIAFVLDQLRYPEEFLSKIKDLFTQQKDVSFDILKFKDGRTFERYSKPQLINGSYVGRVWSFRDVTARKNNEEALRESEKRLRQIIDLVPHFIFAKNAKGIFTLANEAVATAYGSTVKNLIGKSDADFNSNKEEIEHFSKEDLEVIKSGNAKYNIEETITDAAGNIRILSTTKIPYTSVDIPGILGVSVDITERKNTEAASRKSKSQLTLAAQIAKLGYWEFDVSNDLFTFNDQFYSIFKTSAENVGGYTMSSARYAELFVHPDERGIVGKSVGDAIPSDDPYFSFKAEHRIIYATGETGYMSVEFYVVKDKEGRTIKTFGVNQDITERKKGDETLRRSELNLEIKNRELQQKNIELEQFVYMASHDLQEPLRTTSSFVKLLQQKYHGKFDQKADKYFAYILEASERMKELIKNLLDYSQIANKKELEQVDCDKMLHNVLADLGMAISEAGAHIKSDPLPVIYGYATELKQLFQNLITNAIKFRKKETAPAINISVQKNKDYWQFAFRDNGIGIEEKDIEKIFVIFQRLHTRAEYEGSGIGLSHCKKIVELHGGKIWVESKPGEGSTFQFTIHQNHN